MRAVVIVPWNAVNEIYDGFIRKCKARGNMDNLCVLVAEVATSRPGVETYAERFYRETQAMAEEEAEAEGTAAPSAGATASSAPMVIDDASSMTMMTPTRFHLGKKARTPCGEALKGRYIN